MAGSSNWIVEAQRRRVFRALGFYAAFAFALLQLTDIFSGAMGWTDEEVVWVLVVVVAAFPLVLVGAWYVQVDERGLRIDRGPEAEGADLESAGPIRSWVPWAIGGFAVLVLALYAGRLTTDPDAPSAVPVLAEEQPPALEVQSSAAVELDASIAVLPFENLSSLEENAYFAAGIHEDIQTSLARLPDVVVTSRRSTLRYADGQTPAATIAEELNVSYLVEGSVRRAGDQVRITIQLVSARDERHIWSDTYDRQLIDVFRVQAEVAEAVAGELQRELGIAIGPSAVRVRSVDLRAYDLYQQARSRFGTSDYRSDEVQRLLREALELEPEFVDALAWLAQAHFRSSEPDRIGSALAVLEQALSLDPEHIRSLEFKGEILSQGTARRDEGIELLGRAVELSPNDIQAREAYAFQLWFTGRFAEAAVQFGALVRLDPVSRRGQLARVQRAALLGDSAPLREYVRQHLSLESATAEEFVSVSNLALLANDLELAGVWAARGVHQTNGPVAPTNLAQVMLQLGELEAAEYWIEESMRRVPGWDLASYFEAEILRQQGRFEEFVRYVDDWQLRSQGNEHSARMVGEALVVRANMAGRSGAREEMNRLLRQALEAHEAFLSDLLADPQQEFSFWNRYALVEAALTALRLGEVERGRAHFERILVHHQADPVPDQWSFVIASVSAAALGEHRLALDYLQELEARDFSAMYVLGPLAWGLFEDPWGIFGDFPEFAAQNGYPARLEQRNIETLATLHSEVPEIFEVTAP